MHGFDCSVEELGTSENGDTAASPRGGAAAAPRATDGEGAPPAPPRAARSLRDEIEVLISKHHAEIHACITKFEHQQRCGHAQREGRAPQGEDREHMFTGRQKPMSKPVTLEVWSDPTGKTLNCPGVSEGSMPHGSSHHADPFCPQGIIPASPPSTNQKEAENASSEQQKRAPARRPQKSFIIKAKQTEIHATLTALQRLTTHRAFEWVSGVLVVVNAVFHGCVVSLEAHRAHDRSKVGLNPAANDPTGIVVLQFLFNMCFVTELLLRWSAEGLIGFCRSTEKWWNMFDALVASVSALDIMSLLWPLLSKNSVITNTSILRIMRVLRIVRVVRVVRIMRFFRELRMMVFAILHSFKSLFWAEMILTIVFFMFGISMTSGTVDYLDTAAKWNSEANSDLVSFFGTLEGSVLSLYMAMSGGRDWGEYYETLLLLPTPYRLLFLIYITFAILAVVNVVTGVFVDSALTANQNDKDIIVQEELEEKEAYLASMRAVFDEFDNSDTGFVKKEEFERQLGDERVIAYFNALKLDASDARTLFMLLDYDSSGEISINEFLNGCLKLKGESRALDLAIMHYEVRWLIENTSTFRDTVEESLAVIRERVEVINDQLRPSTAA